MKPVYFSDPASAEFTAAVRWYEQRRVGLGAELFDAVVATVDHSIVPGSGNCATGALGQPSVERSPISVQGGVSSARRRHLRRCRRPFESPPRLLARSSVTATQGDVCLLRALIAFVPGARAHVQVEAADGIRSCSLEVQASTIARKVRSALERPAIDRHAEILRRGPWTANCCSA